MSSRHSDAAAPGTGAPGTGAGEEVFSAEDLEPDADLRRQRHKALIDRAAATVAVAAVGLWAGGLVALGTCAAPFVFRLTPYPFSGTAMGAAFQRFDAIAVGCAVVALGCEVVRTLVGWRQHPAIAPRLRRYVAIVMALGAVYGGVRLTPAILRMHQEGIRRNVGAEGAELERLHRQAELIGKVVAPLALLLMGLHVFTLRAPEEYEPDEDDVAPLAPGPRSEGHDHG